MHVLKENKQR